eukprot:12676080-Alexandrium_andersonii.AAC.1
MTPAISVTTTFRTAFNSSAALMLLRALAPSAPVTLSRKFWANASVRMSASNWLHSRGWGPTAAASRSPSAVGAAAGC